MYREARKCRRTEVFVSIRFTIGLNHQPRSHLQKEAQAQFLTARNSSSTLNSVCVRRSKAAIISGRRQPTTSGYRAPFPAISSSHRYWLILGPVIGLRSPFTDAIVPMPTHSPPCNADANGKHQKSHQQGYRYSRQLSRLSGSLGKKRHPARYRVSQTISVGQGTLQPKWLRMGMFSI